MLSSSGRETFSKFFWKQLPQYHSRIKRKTTYIPSFYRPKKFLFTKTPFHTLSQHKLFYNKQKSRHRETKKQWTKSWADFVSSSIVCVPSTLFCVKRDFSQYILSRNKVLRKLKMKVLSITPIDRAIVQFENQAKT